MGNQLTFLRAFPSQIEQTGPRQLTGRLVPYDEVADVLDELPGGKVDVYKEGFRAGAFGPQANITERGVLSKIGFIHRHEGGLGYLGPFVALRDEPDGLYGDVAVLRSKANDVEDLLAAGIEELSVEFRVPRANHTEIGEDGVRWRVRAHLDQVALEPRGAYRTAQVLAYRAEVEEQAQVDAEEAELRAALDREAEEKAEAAIQRRRRFEELAKGYDDRAERQRELQSQYGISQPPRLR